MKINQMLKIVSIVLLLSLPACTTKQEPNPNQPTDEEVLTALSDQLNVDGTYTVLTKFKIVSHAPEGIHDDVTSTFTLKNAFGLFDLKASLRFLKTGDVFKLYSVEYETLSAQVNNAPNPSRALDILQGNTDIMTYYNYAFTETLMYSYYEQPVCEIDDSNYQDGKTKVDCIQQFALLDVSAIGINRFNGSYDFKKGWTYAFDSWTYTETTEFNKPLTFTFPSVMNGEAKLFEPNETVTLNLSGKLIVTYPGTETKSVDNQMTGTMTRKGIITPITVEVVDGDFAYQISFIFGDRPEEVLFLYVDSGGGRCGPSDPPTYYLQDSNGNYAWLKDGLTHSGGISTMSETECGA